VKPINKKKTLISLRLDTDLLSWFKKQQPIGYQTLMHSVLERYQEEANIQAARSCGRAQEIFRRFYAQCFWHYDQNLKISEENIHLVIDGLRKHGGREGLILAEELCQ
jgi:hypothetical protein